MDFLTTIEIQIKAFFFNAQTDYLPYYKNFSFNVTGEESLLDILEMIKRENSDFSYPNKNVVLRINDLVLTADEKIATVVKKLGNELRINPALMYRSNNGLILNDDDFMQSFELLEAYADEEDKAYYKSLYPLHYASASFEYNHNYIGDAVLLLASRLIEKNPDNQDDILNAINDEFNGIASCEYENNLFHAQEHAETIASLKKLVLKEKSTSMIDKLCDLAVKPKEHTLNTENIHERNIALYIGSVDHAELAEETKISVVQSGATFIDFPMSTKLAGQSVITTNPDLAHQKAGKMLLDALDHGADTLLCAEDEDLELFKKMLAKCERVVGRDIELTLISLNKFQTLRLKVAV
jgi:succinate dehydrogenase/fumarate reductase-like Fe-S protein